MHRLQQKKHIVLASDCYSVYEAIKNEFEGIAKVSFLSRDILSPGKGCKHNESYFGVARQEGHSATSIESSQEEVTAMAEILTLAKCKYLVGGRSYFFEAVLGLSSVRVDCVTYIDNADRYIVLPRHRRPIADGKTAKIVRLCSYLVSHQILLDGIFYETSDSNRISLFYFYETLATDISVDNLAEVSELVTALGRHLKSLRFY